MALIGWYPFNGDGLDHSGNNNHLTNSTPLFEDSGTRPGKVLIPYGSQLKHPSILNGKHNCTIAFWLNVKTANVSGDWAQIMSFGDGKNRLRFEVCKNYEGSTFGVANNGGYSNYICGNLNIVLNKAEYYDHWVHWVFSRDDTNVYSYINGKLITKSASTSNNFNPGDLVIQNLFAYLSDLRIYDECLSACEIKELSRGKILEYNFENVLGQTYNNLYSKYSTASGLRDNVGTSFTSKTLKYDDGIYLNFYYKGHTTYDDWKSIWFDNYKFTAGKTYQLSLKLRVNKMTNGDFNVRHARIDNDYYYGRILYDIPNNYVGKGWITINLMNTLPATFTDGGSTTFTTRPRLEFYTCDIKKDSDIEFDFDVKDIMIVETDTELPYFANSTYQNRIYDACGNSGRNLPAMSVNNFKISKETNRGFASGDFSSNSYIEFNSLWGKPIEQMTISFWAKIRSNSTAYMMIFSLVNDPTKAIWLALNTEGKKQWAYINNRYAYGKNGTIPLNEWHMHTITYNAGVVNWYLDGVHEITDTLPETIINNVSSTSKFSIGDSFTGTNWSSTIFDGLISDFAIYSRALDAEDILHLSHNGKFAKNNSMSIFKVQEVENNTLNRNIISQNYLLTSNKITEDKSISKIKISNNSNLTVSELYSSAAELVSTRINGNLNVPYMGIGSVIPKSYSDNSSPLGIPSTTTLTSAEQTALGSLYDNKVYTEPDGTKWIRVFHHNNPAGGLFTATSTGFKTGQLYESADRWYCMGKAIEKVSDSWEIMIKQKETTSSTEMKYRWVQRYNPLTTLWTDVTEKSLGLTKHNKSSGYSTWIFDDKSEGLIKYSDGEKQTFLAYNDLHGSWFCAIGCSSLWNDGIPGMSIKAITTGYLDAYLRISPSSIGSNSTCATTKQAKEYIDTIISKNL